MRWTVLFLGCVAASTAIGQITPAPLDAPTVVVIPGVEAGENLGSSVHDAGDTNGDGLPDLIAGAPFADANGVNSGSARVYSARDGALLFSTAGAGLLDLHGRSVGRAGDIDGDGRDDVIVGAFFADPTGPFAGEARVYSGATGAELFQFIGGTSSDQYGQSVAGIGDINLDGFPDVAIGAWAADPNGNDSGLVEIRSGFNAALLWSFAGDSPNDYLGASVAGAGDFNLDGYDDVIAGAYLDDNGGLDAGMARVYSGQTGAALLTFNGLAAGDELGLDVSGVGDVDGDGFADVAVGARLNDAGGVDAGAVYVISGLTSNVIHTVLGEAAGDAFGSSVSGGGDLNLDGRPDVVVGAPTHDSGATDGGAVYVIDGAGGSIVRRYVGDEADARFGGAVGTVGDVDGDGARELLVGAFKSDLGGGDAGAVRVIIDCPAGFSYFGQGCAGSGGFVPSLAFSGCTGPSDLIHGEITNGLGGSVAVLMVSAGLVNAPLGAGCTLLVAPPIPIAQPLPLSPGGPGQGAFGFSAVLPGSLPSASLVMQAYVLDAGAPLGAAFTRAARMIVP